MQYKNISKNEENGEDQLHTYLIEINNPELLDSHSDFLIHEVGQEITTPYKPNENAPVKKHKCLSHVEGDIEIPKLAYIIRLLLFENKKYEEIAKRVEAAGKNASDELKEEQQRAKAKLSRALIKLIKYNGIDETEYERVKALYESIDPRYVEEKKQAKEKLEKEETRKHDLEYTYDRITQSKVLFEFELKNKTDDTECPKQLTYFIKETK